MIVIESNMLVINSKNISKLLSVVSLIDEIKLTFINSEKVPLREIHRISDKQNSELLIMPSFLKSDFYGVKLLNVFPKNPSKGLKRINASYVLFNKNTGEAKAILDGTELTYRRTAAMSALASIYLSNKFSKKLLIIGTGALVPYMISAHTEIRPIEDVFVWGRDYEKAFNIVKKYKNNNFSITAVKELKDICKEMDIVSTVTSSKKPFLYKELFKEGVHIDLVGAHTKLMGELHSNVFKIGDIYVEDLNFALVEAGDLIVAIKKGVITEKNIKADIKTLIKNNKYVRKQERQSTIFKSVGHPLSDLAAAVLAYKKYIF